MVCRVIPDRHRSGPPISTSACPREAKPIWNMANEAGKSGAARAFAFIWRPIIHVMRQHLLLADSDLTLTGSVEGRPARSTSRITDADRYDIVPLY